jgi:Leucine-rich repeat (LRR) protein
MIQVKFLLVSLLAFGLKEIDAKVFNCAAVTSWPTGCHFDSQVLEINDTATFTVSSGLTPDGMLYVYANFKVVQSTLFYYIPASLFTYFFNVKYVYLYYGNIQEIRNNTFLNAKKLEYLNLKYNNISALEADTFKGAQSLNSLDLGYNQLSSIDSNAFRGLSKLKILFLNNNKLTTFNSQTFAPLNLLYYLYLGFNQIGSLDKDIFKNLTELFYLSLNNNSLQTLDATIFSSTKPSALLLNDNKINALSSKMFQLFYNTRLELDLRSNLCIDQYFGSGSLLNLTQQRALESALETCNKNYRVKVLECVAVDWSTCSFDSQVLGINDTATFTISGHTPANILNVYFNWNVPNSMSFYYIPASFFTIFPNASGIFFNSGNIQEIRSNTFLNATNLHYLNLNSNNISTLGPDAFKGAQNLNLLDLSDIQLSSIDPNAFRGLFKLQYLYLYENKLTTLNSQTFAPLSSLYYVLLYNNQISSLDKDIFRNLTNLVNLYLNNNALQTLEASIFLNVTNLWYLNLNSNNISALGPDAFKGAQNLHYIDVSFNQLSLIDVNAFRGLSKLAGITLNYNKVTTLDKNIFRNLTNLVYLYLNNNTLQTLDAMIFLSNTKMLAISLNGNKITALSTKMFQSFYNTSLELDLRSNLCINQYFASGFLLNVAQQRALESALEACNKSILVKVLNCAELTSSSTSCSFDKQVLGINDTANFTVSSGLTPANIQYIYLNSYVAKSTSFYYIPASLFNFFPICKFMNFRNGNIQEIRSNTFLNATNLQALQLNSNNISTLADDAFKGAQSLYLLDLSYNQLSSIDVNAFRGLSKLSYLYLQNNKLTTLNSQTFAPLSSLYYLNLASNQINSLDKDIFRNLTSLVHLYLNNNSLQTLNATIFTSNSKLLTLSLNGNKISALSSKMFQSFYNTSLALDLTNNICINQAFAGGFLRDVTQQRALESALDTCNKQYVANNPGNSSSLLKDLANLLQNFFVDMSSSVLNVNNVLTNYSTKVTNFTKFV